MSTILDFFTGETATALGWTFVHSLWQSAIIFILVRAAFRVVPAAHARLRYALACGGLFSIMAAAIVTFAAVDVRLPADTVGASQFHHAVLTTATTPAGDELFAGLGAMLQSYMGLLMLAWAIGVAFFSIRMAGGLLQAHRIRASAQPLDNEWGAYVKQACRNLGITRLVMLAESTAISAPVAIGYLKPVILTPVGMLAGLSAEQVETILLHELAHIKRHDYLVNVLQSVMETLFFFNPVVWSLSATIRKEREYCCDDMVIRNHGGARAYAYALTQIAENQLSGHAFALSLASDRNQLLNRIRRIMDASVKNKPNKYRIIVPALLVVVGFACISWLSKADEAGLPSASLPVVQDTIDKSKNTKEPKVAHYSRRSIITIDENGMPHEKVIEEFNGDEALRPLLERDPGQFGGISAMPPGALRMLSPGDTIPVPFRFDDQEWDALSKQLQELGLELEHMFPGGDPSAFMEQFQHQFRFDDEEWGPFAFKFPETFRGDSIFVDPDSFKGLREELERFRDLEFEFEGLREHRDEQAGAFQETLRQDGYLSADETIESLEWNDEHLKVNGKEIREADEAKYRRLLEERFSAGE